MLSTKLHLLSAKVIPWGLTPHFQDTHAWGLGIPAASSPTHGVRAAPGQKVSKAQGQQGKSCSTGWSSARWSSDGWRKAGQEDVRQLHTTTVCKSGLASVLPPWILKSKVVTQLRSTKEAAHCFLPWKGRELSGRRAGPFGEGFMTHCSGQDLLPCKNVRFLETWSPFQNNHKNV